MVSALDRKLLRDLMHMRGQVVTIALVVACGIASYATIAGSHRSLLLARDVYYARHRFPGLFAPLKRAPNTVAARLAEVPGVADVRVRILEAASLPLPGSDEPARGQILSHPFSAHDPLGGLQLTRGRFPEPDRSAEVLVLDAFARAHHIAPDDSLDVVVDGTLRRLRVTGLAIAPEFVFAIAPGELFPDPGRFAVLWMGHDAMAAAFEMKGAFNDVVFALDRGANERAVIAHVNQILAPYGGIGAYGRNRHLSHATIESELSQLRAMARVTPLIFLSVAAFLISMVLGRIVQLQRAQIAALKAIGYGNRALSAHYMKLVIVIVLLGSALGVVAGAYLGEAMVTLYRKYFHFPDLRFSLDAGLIAQAASFSFVAATVGALFAVRRAAALPPAEAMRPEAPATYRRAVSDALLLARVVGQSGMMVLREIERRPMRTLLSSAGIAGAVALLVVGRFSFDAIERYMTITFGLSQRQDMTVSLATEQDNAALRELRGLPGVLRAEGQRMVPARVRVGHRQREITLLGQPPENVLNVVVDADGREVQPLPSGILLTDTLAEILDVHPGETLSLEVLSGKRPKLSLTVAGTVRDMFGLFGYLPAASLKSIMDDGFDLSVAYLRVDADRSPQTMRELRKRPQVLAVTQRSRIIHQFRTQTADQMNVTTWIVTLFAVVIAAGVVYNNARLVLSTRDRDLASLRVIGFRRSEISALLLGEIAIQVLLSIGPGLWLGTRLAEAMVSTADPEQYRFPLTITLQTYLFATMVTLAAATLSALIVRRRVDRLDLIGVLKTRS